MSEPTKTQAEDAIRDLTRRVTDEKGVVYPGSEDERSVLIVASYLQGSHRALSAQAARDLGRFLEHMFRT